MSSSNEKTALLVVDVQYDFLPGGSLAVTDGDAILPVVRRLLEGKWDYVVASQDFHPPGHVSFASAHNRQVFTSIDIPNPLADILPNQPEHIHQMLWPDHCVQGTRGADIEESVRRGVDALVEQGKGRIECKGTDPSLDAYSAFSNYPPPTSNTPTQPVSLLADFLQRNNVKTAFIVGLATEYCVRATALDANTILPNVYVVREAVRAVGGEAATRTVFEEFDRVGVRVVGLEDEAVKELL